MGLRWIHKTLKEGVRKGPERGKGVLTDVRNQRLAAEITHSCSAKWKHAWLMSLIRPCVAAT
jgi:hypothetical protein